LRYSTVVCALIVGAAQALPLCEAEAQLASATFACAAQPGDTCFFFVFGPNFTTRANFDLPGGATRQIPGVAIGQDKYCVGVNQPVASTCRGQTVTDKINQ
jgi:hypothetical protein